MAWYAVPSTISSAKLLNAIAPTFCFRIVYLLENGPFSAGAEGVGVSFGASLVTPASALPIAWHAPNTKQTVTILSPVFTATPAPRSLPRFFTRVVLDAALILCYTQRGVPRRSQNWLTTSQIPAE